ncbi:MAG: hypothetical protein IOD12_14975 [Silvanigrellales bacterium]|nr:hypothetical protein [Silvanigrellales bacterium]
MAGIGIISNPFARVNKKDPEHNTLMWYVLGNKGQFEVTNTLYELSRVCQEFQERGIDLVGIVGGDGTVSLTLSALHAAYGPKALPRILLLRGGTVNVAAANLGIFGRPKDVMADFLDAYHSGKPIAEMAITTLRVNDRLGFLFANGLASNFLREFYRNKSNALGAGLYFARVFADALAAGRITGDYTRLEARENMRIETHPTPLSPNAFTDTEYSMVFASTLPQMPFGLAMYRRLVPGARHAEIIAIAEQGRGLFAQATRLLLGREFSSPLIHGSLFEKATLRVAPGAAYSLDGDLLVCDDGEIIMETGPTFVFCSPYGKVL